MVSAPTVASEWDRFETAVLPPNCSIVQRTETRRAFYAGAWSMFAAIADHVTELPDDEACERLSEYQREFEQYRRTLEALAQTKEEE
jgi:hypothetical protein